MRRILLFFGLSVLSALPLDAQEPMKIVTSAMVCVVSNECFGAHCSERKISFPEREIIAKKLNSSRGLRKVEAKDEGYQKHQGCATDEKIRSCEYVLGVAPVNVSHTAAVPLSRLEAMQLWPGQAPTNPLPNSPSGEFAEDKQQEPLDQASIKFELVRMRDCERISLKEFTKLETAHVKQPSSQSVDWLTSKVAEEVINEISNDVKVRPPKRKP